MCVVFCLVRYKLLHVLEFDANRRRMSVILQTPSGKENLISTVLFPLMRVWTAGLKGCANVIYH